MMTAQNAIDNRQTEDIIFVTYTFTGGTWHMKVLYDSRKTPYDIPLALADYPVETQNIEGDLTIAVI